MNILTKISVVVLVLLVLLFCPVLITLATQQPNFKDLYQKEQARTKALSMDNSVHKVLEQRFLAEAATEKARADSAGTKLAAETAKLAQQLEEEKARAAALEARLASMDLTMKEFQQNLKAMNDRNVALVKSNDDLRDMVNKKTDESRRLGDSLNRQTLNAEALQSQVNFLREQNAQLDDKVRGLEDAVRRGSGGVAGRTDQTPVPGPDGTITGTVTAVKGDIASINCGSAKGIKVGMIATISRGADYVSQLQIQNVDTNQAAGIVIRKKLDPAMGDKFEISSEKGGRL